MRVVIPGGSGQVGQILARHMKARGDEVSILARGPVAVGRAVSWDGRTLGDWARVIDGADVIINLAGRSVNCRYTEANLREMLDSRVESTRVVGQAIAAARRPPRVWLQMSTATIYAHRFDAANGETNGCLSGDEDGVPKYWARSVNIAKAWETALNEAEAPQTRKVALRSAMVMGPDRAGIFDVMLALVRRGLGGTVGGGQQFVSCEAWGVRVGLPATKWMLEIGAWAMRTDTELVLKSRRVVPERLLAGEFSFEFPEWPAAARHLVEEWPVRRRSSPRGIQHDSLSEATDPHPCPRCNLNLVARKLGPGGVLACDRCGGVWIDPMRRAQIKESAAATASLLVLSDLCAEAATVQPGETAAACPVCGVPMKRTPVPGVEVTIDTCVHGTWFDARELRIFAEALKAAAQVRAPMAASTNRDEPPRAAGLLLDSVEALGDVIGVLDLLAVLFRSD
jgi:NAD dependent epimerase/dehydratase family enzyme/Zn-finger nucleic acid-binding protein